MMAPPVERRTDGAACSACALRVTSTTAWLPQRSRRRSRALESAERAIFRVRSGTMITSRDHWLLPLLCKALKDYAVPYFSNRGPFCIRLCLTNRSWDAPEERKGIFNTIIHCMFLFRVRTDQPKSNRVGRDHLRDLRVILLLSLFCLSVWFMGEI